MSETTQIVADAARSRNMQLRGNFRRSAQGSEIVVVLGMHRSGTSLLANILHLLGVDMLDKPTHASTKNETGFWERQDILALQDEILVTLGVPVGSPAHAVPFASGWWRSVEICPLKERLRDLVGEHLKKVRRPWGFKDPRTCRLLPLWGEILEELDVSPRFVWAVRHPAESSRSMTEKNPLRRPIPVAQSEVMWLAYNYDILRYAGRHWPLVVPYEAWFGDALALAKDLAQELDLVWQGSDHELETALSELINPDQRHHWCAGGGGKLRCTLALSEEVYRSILSLRNVSEANVSETLAMSLQSLLGAVQPFALEARESRTLKADAQNLAAEIKLVQARLDEATAQIASHQERAERQRENEAILVARIDALTRKMNDARAARDAVQAESIAVRADLEQQIAGARADAARLQVERDALQGELAKAGIGADEYMRQLADAEARLGEIAARLAQAQAERGRMEERLAQAGEERDALQKEIQAAIAGRETAVRDFGDVSGKLEGFRKQLAAALSGREALEQKLAAAEGERDKKQSDLATARAECDALERKLSMTSESRAALERGLAEMLSSRDASERELASLNTILDGFRSKLAQAIATREDVQQELAALRTERDRLAAELAESVEARTTQRDEVLALSSSRESVERDLAAANQKLDGFRKQITAGNEAREKLEAKLAELTADRDRQAGELAATAQEAAALQVECDRQADELAVQKLDRENLQESLEGMTVERDTLSRTLADLREELQKTRDGAAQESQHFASQLAEARSASAALEDRYAALSATHEALAAELADTRHSAQQSLETAAREQERLAQALDAVSNDRDGLAAQAAETDADVRSQRMLISRLQADADRLRAEFLTAKNALRSERERIAELTVVLPKG